MNWIQALQNIQANGYRKTKNGKYEAFISDHCKTISLGTHRTENDAAEAVLNYRIDRLVNNLMEYDLDPDDGVIYDDNYIVFDNGMIFNLHGERMRGAVNRSGYRQGIFNGHTRDHHKVIADCFIPNPNNLRDVNHKNGDKLDLRIENLERTTHADNVIHAYNNGLITKQYGENHHAHKLTYKDVEYIRSVYKRGSRTFGGAALARKFGVDRTTISAVVNEETWVNIND